MGMLLDIARQATADNDRQNAPNLPPASSTIAPDKRATLAAGIRDSMAERQRRRLLAMLAENPARRYSFLTDTQTDPEAVLLDLAIRDVGTCQLRIPKAKYDGVLLLDLIEKHGATKH
jgi:hypothetical protein